MDFIKGNEQVKIDPSGIQIKGNGNISIDSEKVKGDLTFDDKVNLKDTLTTFADCNLSNSVVITDILSVNSRSVFSGDISINSNTDINNDLSINGNIEISGNEKFVINSQGNVGIGTTLPTANLHIKDTNASTNLIIENDNISTVTLNSNTIPFKLNNINGDLTYESNTSGEIMRIKNNGTIGIGTNNPEYTLEIKKDPNNYNTGAANEHGWAISYYNSDYYTSFANQRIGIKMTDSSIWLDGLGTYFLNSSDRRIKKDITPINDNIALEKVDNLETYEYNYIDPKRKKEMKTIGFMAQDVKEIIPNAVSIQKNWIPDELRVIENPEWEEVDGKWHLTMENLDLSDNFTGRCKFYVSNDPSGNDEICKDLEIKKVDLPYILKQFSKSKYVVEFEKKWNNVFFYGKEITDFHTIDKSQIFAIHHSAIQELHRKHKREVENKNIKIEHLESRIESLEKTLLDVLNSQHQIITKNTNLEIEITNLKSKMTNIEGRLPEEPKKSNITLL